VTEFSVQNILLHTQPIFGILSTDFHKNRQKIPILSMLNSCLKCARFHEMGINYIQYIRLFIVLLHIPLAGQDEVVVL